jgi:hypothetical protein
MVGFPLLLIPLAVYNIIVFLMPGVSLTDTLFKLPLLSGEQWQINLGDILLALGVLLLLLEVIKGARPGAKYLTDHLLSFIVTGAAAAEFLLWPKFGNSTFFMLALLSLVDFFGGIALHARRGGRAAAVAPVQRTARTAEPPAEPVEPHFEPEAAPAPAAKPAPSAASVAESVLLDHPEPKLSQPTGERSPPLASPELHSGNGTPSSGTTQR